MKFIEILEEYNIPMAPHGHHHQTQGWVQFDCPWCGKNTNKFHMGFNLNGGFVNCWRCGPHPLAIVLRELTGLNFKEIKTLITQLDGVIEQPKQKSISHLELPDSLGPMTEPHKRYLTKRGFHWDEIEQLWKVQGIGVAAELSWRLFIPIIYESRVVSWTTRAIGENVKQRYLGAHGSQELVPKSTLLYGSDYVRETVIIVEGPLDVWRIGPGAVATLGINFSQAQVNKLIPYPRRIICFDNEPEAQKQAKRLYNILGPFRGETMNVILDSKDPGVANIIEIKRLRKYLGKK